jgi:hypothetical protein
VIKPMFGRIKDWRRIAMRHERVVHRPTRRDQTRHRHYQVDLNASLPGGYHAKWIALASTICPPLDRALRGRHRIS